MVLSWERDSLVSVPEILSSFVPFLGCAAVVVTAGVTAWFFSITGWFSIGYNLPALCFPDLHPRGRGTCGWVQSQPPPLFGILWGCDGRQGCSQGMVFHSRLVLSGFSSILNEVDVCWPPSMLTAEPWSRTAGEKNCRGG